MVLGRRLFQGRMAQGPGCGFYFDHGLAGLMAQLIEGLGGWLAGFEGRQYGLLYVLQCMYVPAGRGCRRERPSSCLANTSRNGLATARPRIAWSLLANFHLRTTWADVRRVACR